MVLLREADAARKAFADAGDREPAGEDVITAIRGGELIYVNDNAEVVHFLPKYAGKAGFARAVDAGNNGVGFHGVSSLFCSLYSYSKQIL